MQIVYTYNLQTHFPENVAEFDISRLNKFMARSMYFGDI